MIIKMKSLSFITKILIHFDVLKNIIKLPSVTYQSEGNLFSYLCLKFAVLCIYRLTESLVMLNNQH